MVSEAAVAWRGFQRKVAKARGRKAEKIDLLVRDTGVIQPSLRSRHAAPDCMTQLPRSRDALVAKVAKTLGESELRSFAHRRPSNLLARLVTPN